jgi:hypothetical protein
MATIIAPHRSRSKSDAFRSSKRLFWPESAPKADPNTTSSRSHTTVEGGLPSLSYKYRFSINRYKHLMKAFRPSTFVSVVSKNLVLTKSSISVIRACTVMFNVEALKVFKGCICKKILEPSLCEETSLARKPSSNRRLISYCTNLSSVLSICCCTNTFNSVFISRLYL